MDASMITDFSPIAFLCVAVGYLYKTRPTRHEVNREFELAEKQRAWIMDALWEITKGQGVSVSPPPRKNGEKRK